MCPNRSGIYIGQMQGGCWYCGYDETFLPLIRCHEFDTFIHEQCVREALARNDPNDREVMIIAREVFPNEYA